MEQRWLTVVVTENKNGRITEHYQEVGDLKSAARIMLTFKPKQGSKVVGFKVDELPYLV